MNVETLLEYFLWSATQALKPPNPRQKKFHLAFTLTPSYEENGKLSSVQVLYPALDWRALCDHQGLLTKRDQVERRFAWTDVPPKLFLDVQQGYSALYQHRNDIIQFPIAKRGCWAELEAPGWFGLTLYNALLKAGCKQVI